MQNKEEKLQRKAEYEFSIGLRLTHWVRAIAIVILIGTGYYLSYVFQSPISNGEPVIYASKIPLSTSSGGFCFNRLYYF